MDRDVLKVSEIYEMMKKEIKSDEEFWKYSVGDKDRKIGFDLLKDEFKSDNKLF